MELHEAATLNLPYKSDMPVSQALDVIQQFKSKLATTQQTQMSMQAGLDVFHMDTPEHVELREVQRDIELLEQIWGISSEWEALWSGWKTGLFESLDVSEMESVAAQYNKKIGKLGRDIKKWKIWETMKDRIQQFQQTMPLIQDLKNPALRIRHWESLRTEVGRFFDPLSAGFNLEAVLSLGLHQHVDFISELSANANKELSIEQSLASIALRWQSIDIETAPYKGTYKISSTDDLFQVLEDDSVQLSTIKSSRFYPSFAEDVDRWEGALNTVSEVVEMLLSLQRKWIYLESIFMASEDICRQLPQESALFMDVNAGFAATIEHVYHDPNAYRACCDDPEMLSKLVQMDEKLEHIQKSLDQYLETKRIIFPRFYFVSDDDLLEVLGQGRDPMAVQKHLKKCFEGVKSAHLVPPTKSPSKQWEATGLTSPDGEGVELASSLILEGPVEQWLSDLELSMQVAIQKILALSIQAYKGKKEKWVRDFQGQILITTGAIQWTADCSRALGAISAGNKGALKALKKKQTNYLNKLSDMVRGQLSRIERNKVAGGISSSLLALPFFVKFS
jgi:dynein heavy chain